MKRDLYNHKERWFKWKESIKGQILGLSKENSKWILQYLEDMEYGINISLLNVKGPRSFTRLNNLREKMISLATKFKKFLDVDDITQVTERQLYKFFADMRNGVIKRNDGKPYMVVADSVKAFKAFWHWYQKVSSKEDKEIKDITAELDTSKPKPKWVYLTEEEVRKLCDGALQKYKVLMMFLFDTGIRSPGELMNIKVSDLYNDCKELQIREEISKTFGRKIKLMICSELVKEHIKSKNLTKEDYLFSLDPNSINKYLKRLAGRILGEELSPAGQKYSDLTMYDFRHVSCCYWLPRYKSESALKYRFGWKKSDKIHYYSELLGMRDTISEEDLLIDVTKTEIENRLNKSEKEKELMQDRVDSLENQMKEILELTDKLGQNLKEGGVLV